MEEVVEDVKEQLEVVTEEQVVLVLATAAAAVIGTLVVCGLCCRNSGKKVKKRADGKGPTGKGKAKIYHSKGLRSSRVVWLIEGWSLFSVST